MTYANADEQREACRQAMKRYRERLREGKQTKGEEPPKCWTPPAITIQIGELKKRIKKLYDERADMKYNSKEYRNQTSYISKLNNRIENWQYHLTLKGDGHYYTEADIRAKLAEFNEKLEEYNKQKREGTYRKVDSTDAQAKQALNRLNARIKNVNNEIKRWEKLLKVVIARGSSKAKATA